ncbi:hypothetical protein MKEN_00461900 [Mycena kentingensis (nom. inval.)]|nr:hypothetical protein MKEN_00461900 [Mycena kentingensis (nom. inval.)]
MRIFVALFVQLVAASGVAGLGILLPLYAYPNDGCGAWSSVNSAISAHSSTQWYIIINPDSGPGSTDTTYQNCVAALSSSSNRITMGYIDTTSRRGSVNTQIDTYAGWPSAARPTGIYLDVISPTAGMLSTYEGYASYARSKGFSFIGLGAGQSVPDAYLSLGDLVTTYEASYTEFNPASLSGSASKQAIDLANAPSSGSYAGVIDRLQSMGVQAVYISDLPISSDAVPSTLSGFAGEVAAAAGGSSSGGGGSTGGGGGSSGSTEGGGSGGGDSDSSNNDTGSGSGTTPTTPASGSPADSPASGSGSGASGTSTRASAASPSGSAGASGTKVGAGNIATGSDGAAAATASPSSSSGSGSNSGGGSDPSSSNSAASSSSGHAPPIAAIVGGVLGVLILLLLLALFLCWRRRRERTTLHGRAVAPFTAMSASVSVSEAGAPASVSVSGRLTSTVETHGQAVAPSAMWGADVKGPLPLPSSPSSTGISRDAELGLGVGAYASPAIATSRPAPASPFPSSSPSVPAYTYDSPDPSTVTDRHTHAHLSTPGLAAPNSTSTTRPHSFLSGFSSYTASTVPTYPGQAAAPPAYTQ